MLIPDLAVGGARKSATGNSCRVSLRNWRRTAMVGSLSLAERRSHGRLARRPRILGGRRKLWLSYASFDDLTSKINNLAPQASVLLINLNARVTELQKTIRRVNGLLNANNRANFAASLANARAMLAEDRPVLHSTLNNLNSTSSKLAPPD